MDKGLSLIGTWMQKVAQQWVIYEMTKSPVILGLIGVFQYTPMLLLSLFSGSIINRFPKKGIFSYNANITSCSSLNSFFSNLD